MFILCSSIRFFHRHRNNESLKIVLQRVYQYFIFPFYVFLRFVPNSLNPFNLCVAYFRFMFLLRFCFVVFCTFILCCKHTFLEYTFCRLDLSYLSMWEDCHGIETRGGSFLTTYFHFVYAQYGPYYLKQWRRNLPWHSQIFFLTEKTTK